MRHPFPALLVLGLACLHPVTSKSISDAESKAQVLVTPRGDPAPFPHFPAVTALPPIPAESNPPPPDNLEFPPGLAAPILPVSPAVPAAPFAEAVTPAPLRHVTTTITPRGRLVTIKAKARQRIRPLPAALPAVPEEHFSETPVQPLAFPHQPTIGPHFQDLRPSVGPLPPRQFEPEGPHLPAAVFQAVPSDPIHLEPVQAIPQQPVNLPHPHPFLQPQQPAEPGQPLPQQPVNLPHPHPFLQPQQQPAEPVQPFSQQPVNLPHPHGFLQPQQQPAEPEQSIPQQPVNLPHPHPFLQPQQPPEPQVQPVSHPLEQLPIPEPTHPEPIHPPPPREPQPIHRQPFPSFQHPHPAQPEHPLVPTPRPQAHLVPVTSTSATPVDVSVEGHPRFSYNYGVSDPITGDQKTHTETRDGDVVKDGSIRTVTYTADSIHGFQAVVETTPPSVARKPPSPADFVEAPVTSPAPPVVRPEHLLGHTTPTPDLPHLHHPAPAIHIDQVTPPPPLVHSTTQAPFHHPLEEQLPHHHRLPFGHPTPNPHLEFSHTTLAPQEPPHPHRHPFAHTTPIPHPRARPVEDGIHHGLTTALPAVIRQHSTPFPPIALPHSTLAPAPFTDHHHNPTPVHHAAPAIHPSPRPDGLVPGTPVPEILQRIPGINLDHLTEADLLLADPATHTHPLGTHPLLAIHPGYDVPHSHPPYNQHPVIDVATGAVLSAPGLHVTEGPTPQPLINPVSLPTFPNQDSRDSYPQRENFFPNPYSGARFNGRRPQQLAFPVSVAVPPNFGYDLPVKHLQLKHDLSFAEVKSLSNRHYYNQISEDVVPLTNNV